METVQLAYKKDAFGNDIFARVSWVPSESAKAIALAYHGGGLLVGSSEIIPKAQIGYLTSHGFVVVATNYRLCPQVTAADAFADCVEAYNWTISTLPSLLFGRQTLDTAKIVTLGHSSGGTLALHVASLHPTAVSASTAFYPSLYTSDPSTTARQPWKLPVPMASAAGSYVPTDEDWAAISPPGTQVSEAQLAAPGQIPPARNRWQMSLLAKGEWLSAVCPEGDFEVTDPLTRVRGDWPPVMLVQGDADDAPGSSLELALRAERDMKRAGVREVELEVVKGAGHMFELTLAEGGKDWQSVVRGLDWLRSHV